MDYDILKLKDIIILEDKKRKPLSTMERSKRKGNYPYYGAQEIIDYVDDYIFDDRYILLAEDGENLKSRKKDLVKIVEGKFWLNNHAHIFKVKENIDLEFLYYSLLKMDLSEYITGTTQPKLNQENMNNILVKIPKLEIQKKISKILSNIDNKIKSNNEISNNLYEISKQILLKYLDDNRNSEEINISELLTIFTGKKNANETSQNGKYKFFSCAPDSLLSDTYIYDGPAIIIAGNGAYTGRTRFYDGKFELYQRTYGLTLKDGVNKNNIYGLYVFMKIIFEPDKMGGTHGSAIPYIVLSDLTDYKLKYNKSEFDNFSDLVSNNIKMIQENEKSNETLYQLRDTLLSKLMNGEINLDKIKI